MNTPHETCLDLHCRVRSTSFASASTSSVGPGPSAKTVAHHQDGDPMREPPFSVRQGMLRQRTDVPLHLQVQQAVDVGLDVVEEPALVAFEVLDLRSKQRSQVGAGGCLRFVLLCRLRCVEELHTMAVVNRLCIELL